MEQFLRRISSLLTVKSIVTVTLTSVFAWMSLRGAVSADQFLTVFTVVIAFYFGTQTERKQREQREQEEKP